MYATEGQKVPRFVVTEPRYIYVTDLYIVKLMKCNDTAEKTRQRFKLTVPLFVRPILRTCKRCHRCFFSRVLVHYTYFISTMSL